MNATKLAFFLLCFLTAPSISSAQAVSSLAFQHLEAQADTDPLGAKTENTTVSGGPFIGKAPAAGSFFEFAIRPGHGGYPGARIVFDRRQDFSVSEVLAVWFKADAPSNFFQVVLNDTQGVSAEHPLVTAFSSNAAFIRPNLWQRAYIPYKAEPGWVRFGDKLDLTRIKSLTFYTWDNTLSTRQPLYRYQLGGVQLLSLSEARNEYRQTQIRTALPTARLLPSNRAAMLWTADAGEKIFRDSQPPTTAKRAVSAVVSAAANEYASLNFVVRPATDWKNVQAEAGKLVSGKNTIDAAKLVLRYVDYVPALLFDAPDPLPLLAGKEVRVRSGENFQLWATVRVPENTKPGIYKGKIRLSAVDAANHKVNFELPLQVRVYKFSLPGQPHLKTDYAIQHLYSGVKWFEAHSERYWGHHIKPYSPEYKTLFGNIVRDYGEHRITPEFHVGLEYYTFDEKLALHRRYGFDPVFALGHNIADNYDPKSSGQLLTPLRREQLRANWKAAGEQLKAAGVANLSSIKIGDEPTAEFMPYMKMAAEDTNELIPYVQRFAALGQGPLPKELIGVMDTWCMNWGAFDFLGAQAQERKKAGDRFWTYAADYKLNTAYEPLDIRTLYWLYWKFGITGVHYAHHLPGFFLTYPNDTYPHSDGLEQIPSIRWEMIRQGMQDYEYLWLLQQAIDKSGAKGDRYRELLKIPPALAADEKNYSMNPQTINARRETIARAIEALQAN